MRWWLAGVLGLAVVTGAGNAEACSCSEGLPSRPVDDGTEAPRNTLVWMGYFSALSATNARIDRTQSPSPGVEALTAAVALHDSSGTDVPFTVELFMTEASIMPFYYVLHPTAELSPGRYSVGARDGSKVFWGWSFQVGDFRLEMPPAVPAIADRDEKNDDGKGSSCGPAVYVSFDLRHDGTFTALDLAYRTQTSSPQRTVVASIGESRTVYIGDAGCIGTWDFHKGPVTARFAAYDLAGNHSEWSNPVTVEEPKGCGCSLASPRLGSSGAAWAGLLGMVAAARYRRRGTASL